MNIYIYICIYTYPKTYKNSRLKTGLTLTAAKQPAGQVFLLITASEEFGSTTFFPSALKVSPISC